MKEKIILGVIILLILGGAFYWFEWRPTQIRKECSGKLLERWYEECLREHGLEK